MYRSKTTSKSTIVTASVERRDLEQIVSVVGTVDVVERVKLSARRSGPVVAIAKKVGGHVRFGESIVEMKSSDERLSLQQADTQLKKAQADLQLRLAGESKESLDTLLATTQQRAAELQKTKDDLDATRRDEQIVVRTQQQLVADAQTNVKLAAQSGFTSASTALNDADGILGIDARTSNDAFEDNLAVKDSDALVSATNLYGTTKTLRADANTALATASVEQQASAVRALLDSTTALLASVSRVLETSVTDDSFSPTTLSGKQTTIATDRTAVNAAQSSLETKLQAFHSTTLTQESSVHATRSAVVAKENAIAVATAAYGSAKATEQAKRVAPRAVDIASLQALVAQYQVQISQAQQAVEDTIVRAPVDGVISDIPVKIGEVVAANQAVAEVLGNGRLEITANIPEVDIGKMSVAQKATMTLDAFGSSETFTGVVVSIDPAQTVVEGVATYTVKLQFDQEDPRVRPGMTANIDMVTARRENALVIPQRAIRTVEGTTIVKLRSSVTVTDVPLSIGLIGSDGFAEVLSGLQEGQAVVVSGE